jgi:hypothetical protein
MATVIGRLIEFGAVLGISALISIVLNGSIVGLGYTSQIATITSWLSFFIMPMIYYRLFHLQGRGRFSFA